MGSANWFHSLLLIRTVEVVQIYYFDIGFPGWKVLTLVFIPKTFQYF